MARLASHEGFFGEMKRTSRSNSFEDWGHAWAAQDSLPPLPVKRGREEKVETDSVQLRRQALRLCLEQARGSQGIYRADYGISRDRYVESLMEQRGKQPAGVDLQGEGLGKTSQGEIFAAKTQSTLFTQRHDQSEVGAMFAAPSASSTLFPQSTGLFGSSTTPNPSFPQSSAAAASDPSPDTTHKRRP